MYFAVKAVTPVENYKHCLTYKNGEEKIFDMTPYLEIGKSKALKDESVFKKGRVCFDTVEWESGADIDPETLFFDSVALQGILI
jgi:hypothetical protein